MVGLVNHHANILRVALRKMGELFVNASGKVKRENISNSQESVTDQLFKLKAMANRNGLYDAADWIEARLKSEKG